MPQEFLFQHDIVLPGEMLRFAILKFTDQHETRIQYAACVAEVDNEDYFDNLIGSTITDTLDESVIFLQNMFVQMFCDVEFQTLYEELGNVLKSVKKH